MERYLQHSISVLTFEVLRLSDLAMKIARVVDMLCGLQAVHPRKRQRTKPDAQSRSTAVSESAIDSAEPGPQHAASPPELLSPRGPRVPPISLPMRSDSNAAAAEGAGPTGLASHETDGNTCTC